MSYTQHKLGKTFYKSQGKKSLRPLICLHGGPGGTHKGLLPLLELSRTRKVYVYDQIGSGKSSAIDKKKWKIETFVEELDLLIKKWGIKEFDLFGASWGTTLALEYYLRKKGKGVKSIIFQSPMFSAKDWQKDADLLINKLPAKTKKVIKACHEIGATDSKVYKEAIFEYYKRHVLRDEKKLHSMVGQSTGFNEDLYNFMWGPSEFKSTGTLKSYNRVKDLAKIKVPTLIVCGQYDEARPETAIRYVNKIKTASFSEIKGCSHAILSENPKKLLKTIEQFLK